MSFFRTPLRRQRSRTFAKGFRPRLEQLEARLVPSFADGFGAVVTNLAAQNNGSQLVITFDGPLDATPANPVQSPTNVANYSIEVPTSNPEVVTSSLSSVAISTAAYSPNSADPAHGPSQVTLNLASPLTAGTFYRVFINGSADAENTVNPGLIDANNQPIDGDYDDTPSGDFYKLFAWTTSATPLNFNDFQGDSVTLTLQGPGQLNAWRELDGDFDAVQLALQADLISGSIQQLSVVNGVLGQTSLLGTALLSPTGNGVVVVSPIAGAGIDFTNLLPSNFQYQTPAALIPPLTPVPATPSNLPYTIQIQQVNMNLPVVQSADTALDNVPGSPFNGYWLIFGGRTNGRHTFDPDSNTNFPPQNQNEDIIVVNPVTGQTWTEAWQSTDVPAALLPPLYSSNQQFFQQGNTLYTIGGYGAVDEGNGQFASYATYDTLTALNVDGLISAVVNGGSVLAQSQLQQISDLRFQVTGGALAMLGNQMVLVLGQDFQGEYQGTTMPTQTYIDEIRTFTINYNGAIPNSLSISDYQAQNDQANLRRRDFNFGVVNQSNGQPALEVFGGVFLPGPQTDPFAAAYRNQVIVSGVGNVKVTQYQQFFNQYTVPNIGLFDASTGSMYTISFGGISLYAYDSATGALTVPISNFSTPPAPGLAFVNNVTTLVQNANGTSQEYEMSPLPGLYGAEAAFFPTAGLPSSANGVLQLDQLTQPTTLGYMYGGIVSNIGLGGNTAATGAVFKITLVPRQNYVAVGTDAGPVAEVKVFDANTNTLKFDIKPYGGFTGGVRVALGDVNGDGVPDIITAPGPGGGPQINIYDGQTGNLIRSFFAYNPTFAGGVFVAAGDFNADGYADVVTGADAGGGPEVEVFDGQSIATSVAITTLYNNFVFNPAFMGGVRVAAGDTNGAGRADLIVGAGPGGGPQVEVLDLNLVGTASGSGAVVLGNFFPYAASFTGGVYVAAGNLNSSGHAAIITGPGAGGGPQVMAFSLANGSFTTLLNFFAFDPTFAGGVRVGAVLQGSTANIVAGAGPGGGPEVEIFSGLNGQLLDEFFAFDPSVTAGLYVGGLG
jgi:hypothetical protein